MPDSEAKSWLRDKCLIMKMMRDDVVAGDTDSEAAEETLRLILSSTGHISNQEMPSALEEAASIVSDDLCILEAHGDDDWRFTAGVLCAPTYWTLSERIGLDLAALHAPVPGGDPLLANRIARVFSGLRPDFVLERFNWTIQPSEKKYTPDRPTVNGKTFDDLHLRVERQTVRKLSKSGAILFCIRVSVDPLRPILKDPIVREAFEDAWLGAGADVRRYKHWRELEVLVSEACRLADRDSSRSTLS